MNHIHCHIGVLARERLLRGAAGLVTALVLGSSAAAVFAQPFPSKPIRLIVSFSAGSTNDIVARSISDKLSAALGQPVLVENRAGAGGTLGAGLVASASPDGHTLLVSSSNHTISPAMMSNLPFDTLRDFSGVTMLVVMPVVLVASAQARFGSVGELIAFGRSNPGKLNYASAGNGSSTHLNAEKFRVQAAFEAVHIPFKGTSDGMAEIVGGRVDYMFAPLAATMPFIQSGKLKALAVGSPTRLPQWPIVPTTAEAGVADYVFWVGLLAPSKTPRAIVERLNAEVAKVLESADVKARFETLGARASAMKPEEFDGFIREELAANQRVVNAAQLKEK